MLIDRSGWEEAPRALRALHHCLGLSYSRLAEPSRCFVRRRKLAVHLEACRLTDEAVAVASAEVVACRLIAASVAAAGGH